MTLGVANECEPRLHGECPKMASSPLRMTCDTRQMDCWWNAATENQAIDRVHRIGQESTVYVTHFIVCCLLLLHTRLLMCFIGF